MPRHKPDRHNDSRVKERVRDDRTVKGELLSQVGSKKEQKQDMIS